MAPTDGPKKVSVCKALSHNYKFDENPQQPEYSICGLQERKLGVEFVDALC